jgi:putative spermidine/putrescine transport system ATP-binding protein
MAYIQFDRVNKYFGSNHVLKDISLAVNQGELVTFLGPSGCGKSTLLRCLAGLEKVSSGTIRLNGEDITDLSPQKREIGMVFQAYSLFPNLTVEQNIAFGLHILHMDKKTIAAKVREVLGLVGLEQKLKCYPRQLSGGQQQRVALARSIVMEPKVLLLDEPLSAIDALLRRNLQMEIRCIQRELKITTLFVTHDQDEAIVMSDRIHLFNMDVIEQSGRSMELYANPQTRFAATFIGNYNIVPAQDFGRLTQETYEGDVVAIRPEIIEITTAPQECAAAYCLPGEVPCHVPHGNIIRYTVACGDVLLNVDRLFDSSHLPQDHDRVYLSIQKDHVLALQ